MSYHDKIMNIPSPKEWGAYPYKQRMLSKIAHKIARHDTAEIANEADAEIDALKARVEALEEFARDVVQWSEAYPVKVFGEPTAKQVDAVCKLLGFRLDKISAMVLREYAKRWGDKARNILGEEPTDENGYPVLGTFGMGPTDER